jgi:methyl-accepting chemotaxis protein
MAEAIRASNGEDREPGAKRLLGLVLGRRRTFIVDWRYQVRVAAIATGFAAVGFLGLVGTLYVQMEQIRRSIVRADADLARELGEGALLHPLLVVAVGLVIIAGVFVVMIFESHRTAGAAVALKRGLDGLADGRYGSRVELRSNDRLHNLEAAINQLAERLGASAKADAEALGTLAIQAEAAKDADETSAVADELREIVRRRTERLAG